MSEFDAKARTWDLDQKHIDRAEAIAAAMRKEVKFMPGMKALEYGAGTGLLSFLLRDEFQSILLMDNSKEMIGVCLEKIEFYKTPDIKALHFDLESRDYPGKFDIIYNQMVLHHVKNTGRLLDKFYSLLTENGQLVIADLYEEEGSFHNGDTNVHKGFNPDHLLKELNKKGFKKGSYSECYRVNRNDQLYPVFLLIAEK